jgi:hypothetical protein
MMNFDWVWLSTDAQITALIETYGNASLKTKLLGNFKVPANAAHFRSYALPWVCVPAVFVAEGNLTIRNDTLRFTPHPHFIFGWRALNVRADLAFESTAAEIIRIEPADFQSPMINFFNLPFTRVRTNLLAAPLDNFLLCAGGRINMPRIRTQSLALRHALLALAEKAPAERCGLKQGRKSLPE